jgi:hypothetical protein
MKTINSIIEWLRQEHGHIGCAGVLESNLSDFQKHPDDDFYHGKLIGFLWGLNATGGISDEQREAAYDELHSFRWPPKKEEAAPAATETTSNEPTTVNVSSAAPDVKGG